MSTFISLDADASGPQRLSFKAVRAFKALDDGKRRKWVLVVRLQDLPATFPLDANARVPNVLKNKTCREMRATLLTQPELFQVLNGGVVCTADELEVRQVDKSMYVDITFDSSGGQGIVNGGHSYAAALHVAHGVTSYSDGKDIATVLADDTRRERGETRALVEDTHLLTERIAKSRQDAYIQIEVVAPIPDPELLEQIARARNLSQSVEDTALANLAGRFDYMKEVLLSAFGSNFVQRVVWKTNQEVPEGSRRIPVKLLLQIMALMNIRTYQPGLRVANEVYSRSGLVIRDFVEAEGELDQFCKHLVTALPAFLELYDKVYLALPESDPQYPWATGRLGEDAHRLGGFSPVFAVPCGSKVFHAFVWPIFAALRTLLCQPDPNGGLWFQLDPFALFEEKRQELIETVKSFHKNQAHGIVQQVGKDKELWIRLEAAIEKELDLRRRLDSLGKPIPAKPTRTFGNGPAIVDVSDDQESTGEEMYTNRKPCGYKFCGQFVPCFTWKGIYTGLAESLAAQHRDFEARVQHLHGFNMSRHGMRSPHRIVGSNIYMETNRSANELMKRTDKLLDHFGYSKEEFKIVYE